MLDRSGRPQRSCPRPTSGYAVSQIEMVHKIMSHLPEAREPFWRTFVKCQKSNPAALRYIVTLMAFYLHLGPFAREVIAAIDARLIELDLSAAMGNGTNRGAAVSAPMSSAQSDVLLPLDAIGLG